MNAPRIGSGRQPSITREQFAQLQAAWNLPRRDRVAAIRWLANAWGRTYAALYGIQHRGLKRYLR